MRCITIKGGAAEEEQRSRGAAAEARRRSGGRARLVHRELHHGERGVVERDLDAVAPHPRHSPYKLWGVTVLSVARDAEGEVLVAVRYSDGDEAAQPLSAVHVIVQDRGDSRDSMPQPDDEVLVLLRHSTSPQCSP